MGDSLQMRGLLSIDDPLPAAWLRDRIHNPTQPDVKADSIVPAGFAAYARILHPAYRHRQEPPLAGNDSVWLTWLEDHTDVEVRWEEIAQVNHRVFHPEVQFASLVGYIDDYYRHSQPGLWDVPPEVGTLPARQSVELVRTLTSHTSTPGKCWFAVWEGWGDTTPRSPRGPTVCVLHLRYYLYTGPLAAARQSVLSESAIRYQSASLWWPDDHAWCVATDIDSMDTYIGGSIACIDQLLVTPGLEVLPASITDSVGINGDQLNPPPKRE